jgi:NAD-dependent histone deacetylase SIR2
MLIVMGTSLKVHGLKKMVKEFAKAVHGQNPHYNSKAKAWTGRVIFVNKTPPAAEWADIIDYHVAAETDIWVNKVIEDWKKMRPADWEVQQKLVVTSGDVTVTGALKHVKENISTKAEIKGQCPPIILQCLLIHEQATISLVQNQKILLLLSRVQLSP